MNTVSDNPNITTDHSKPLNRALEAPAAERSPEDTNIADPARFEVGDIHQNNAEAQEAREINQPQEISEEVKAFTEKNSTPEEPGFFERLTASNPSLKKFFDNFGLITNSIAAVFHTVASAAPFLKSISKPLAEKIDNFAVQFARYIVPLNFIKNGIEALENNNIVESVIRFSLPTMLMSKMLPFVNFMVAYGLHSGLSIFYQEAIDGLKAKSKDGQVKFKNFSENVNMVFGELKNVCKNITKASMKSQGYMLSGILMLIGSVGGLLFARNDRDTFFAKLFGVLFRNLGGAVGDLVLIAHHPDGIGKNMTWGEMMGTIKKDGLLKFIGGYFSNFTKAWKKSPDAKMIGGFAGVASLLGPVLRYVKDDRVGNIVGHIIEAFNNFAYTIWGNMNRRLAAAGGGEAGGH